ncbi:MAG: hypothetical protein KGO21_00040 [Hyphomicrobiales bacterium]|nr:hypothetical protein [Hyphomicrobiales bacterium]
MKDLTTNNSGPNPFDPKSLAVRQTGGENFAVKKVHTVIGVRKPNSKEWVRVHPSDEYQIDVAVFEDSENGVTYIATPEIALEFSGDFKFVGLKLAVNRQGSPFLWKHPPVDPEGRDNLWNASHREALATAKDVWVKMTSNRSLGAYECQIAPNLNVDPEWPELNLEQLLEIAFRGRLISDSEHILLRQLRGEA